MVLLERHFEIALETPDGIKKLREVILSLAMQGKLVQQDPNDQPASELLKIIQTEKKKLTESGSLKSDKKTWAGSLINPPYEIPQNWSWTRLQDVFEISRGGSPRPAGDPRFFGGTIPWITVGEITKDNNMYLTATATGLTTEGANRSRFINPDDLLLTNSGATLGVPKISKIKGCMNDGVAVLRIFHSFNINDYTYYFLTHQTPVFRNVNQGMGQPNLNTPIIAGWYFPLPPLAEQKRIVAKIDQLMALCDKLETERNERNQKRLTIHKAAMDRLLSVPDKRAFDSSWGFITKNFSELYSVPENVEELKKAILQLAVMGKLVPQNPNDQPASELLKEIEDEKRKLIEEGKMKQQEPLPPIKPEEIPYELPMGWEWVRLGDVAKLITKGSSPKWQGVNYTNGTNGVLFITSENVNSYKLKLLNKKYVESHFNEIEPRSILQKFDILMNIVGASIGRVAYYDLDEVANINQAVCLIRLVSLVCPFQFDFLLHFLNSDICISYMFDKQVDNARANLSMSNISKFLIPVPPIAEQKRIITKVDQLLKLCDSLELQIKDSTDKETAILNAILAKV